MRAKELYAIVGIAATLGTMVGMTTVAFTQTAVADQGGIPDDSATSGPACDNAFERNEKHHELGLDQGHISSNHNGKGVEFGTCF
jgi:hypothetical protein